MKHFFSCIIIVFAFSFSGCQDGVQPDLETQVQGTVYDAVKQKNLADVKVYLSSCKQVSYGNISCSELMDSTWTDGEGRFQFNFRSKAGDFGYDVEIAETEAHTRDRTETGGVELVDGNITAGKRNEVVLRGREFHYFLLDLQVRDNIYPPLTVISQNTVRRLWGAHIDTTMVLRVLPQAENLLIFSVWDPQVGKYRKRMDTYSIGMQDTTRSSVTLRIPDMEVR